MYAVHLSDPCMNTRTAQGANQNAPFQRRPVREEPRFNEMPRDWGNLFVIFLVCYIECLDIAEKQPKCSLYQGIVNDRLFFNGVTLHYPAFPDLNDNR